MSLTFPGSASHIKKGTYVIIDGHPCKCVDNVTSKNGKHGHCKCNIVGVDVFTGKKYNTVPPSSATMQLFELKRFDYQVTNIDEDEGVLELLDDKKNNFPLE